MFGKSKKIKDLEDENTQLKQELANQKLLNQSMKKVGYGVMGGCALLSLASIVSMMESIITKRTMETELTKLAKTNEELVKAWNDCSNNLNTFNQIMQDTSGQQTLADSIILAISKKINESSEKHDQEMQLMQQTIASIYQQQSSLKQQLQPQQRFVYPNNMY
jgi:hypothetical protein